MTKTAAEADAAVLTSVAGGLARIELNKPRAINALSHDMVEIVAEALATWREDDAVAAVVVTGSGERGLCAGGDIKAIHRALVEGTDGAARFWADEYRMNSAIARYPKPYIALMDGIVMGGGVGISAYASHRIVTETSQVGMPETGIGLFPDVGGTWLLARVPHRAGMHMALTGEPVGPADAIRYGLADTFVPRERLPELLDALAAEPGDVDAVLARFAAEPPASGLEADEEWIAEAYAHDTAAEVVEALAAHPSPRAQETAATIRTKSPLSVAVTFEMVRTAGEMTLDEVLERDFAAGVEIAKHPDLREGIRAQVIDKDRNPQWRPASLAELDPSVVAAVVGAVQDRKVFS
ncbi:enoyl-CoA hydratase/isomerase family protein [Brevibacterium album]|uniref:enoyl-CoA hydratase/isomerase family protein n=1 Tax=Brevibacterium album TaxID=417948 RepID=UPI000419643B|nr:enoyl-CoA hydratase/isomerase family protein [Brevibacterium album]